MGCRCQAMAFEDVLLGLPYGRVSALRGHQPVIEQHVKWGVYWLSEVRTWRGTVRAVGGIRSREASQFWWASSRRGPEECRRLAKVLLEKSGWLRVEMWNRVMSNFFA